MSKDAIMGWKVEFYSEKVLKNIKEWPVQIRAKFTWITNLMEEFGIEQIGMPHIKALGKGLFEIRAQGNEGIGRAFFCIIQKKRIIILHEFIKKTQKTPQKEMEIARKRMLEFKE